jgi:hypothetical protein
VHVGDPTRTPTHKLYNGSYLNENQHVTKGFLQKAFSSQFSPSMPIPLWQEINLRADRWNTNKEGWVTPPLHLGEGPGVRTICAMIDGNTKGGFPGNKCGIIVQ